MLGYIVGSIVFLWLGWSLLKTAIKAYKYDERGRAGFDPKFGIISGPLLILAGVASFVRFVIMPLFE